MSGEWATALNRTLENNIPRLDKILSDYPYLEEHAERLRRAKSSVIARLDYYTKMTCEAVEKSGGVPHLAKDRSEAQRVVGEICGSDGIVLFSKTNVGLELGLRESLLAAGHEVWETDLGEFLIQLAEDHPSHIVQPALHLTKEMVGRLLHDKLDRSVSPDSSYEDLVFCVRSFLFKKYVAAKVGITGANAVAADTGSVVLVENEGNIRMDTVVPSIHIAVTGVDKIVPTFDDAFLEAQVQAAHAGLYPPTYINITSGPSSTADIESKKVIPATGPKEFHLVLVDNGRIRASQDSDLKDALLCIRCGRCYFACPVYWTLGSDWSPPPYGGPMGAMWSAIVADDTKPASLCTHSGGCKVVCPVKIDIPRVLEHVKSLNSKR
ncbi:MAG TPA: lactate utilization protein B [Nitrososphaerales archaeon]|nr:lactate utilization protein B [Nitrososphaerales archaeon]